MSTRAEIAAYIARYRPVSVSGPAACFARDVVMRAAPGSTARARALLWAAGKLADFSILAGLEPVPGVLLHPSVIERFAATAPGLSGPARRTLRASLRFIARQVAPALDPVAAALPRERSKIPYSDAEIAGYLALADAQPTLARRMRAAGLVCLGAGAGLIRGDLRQVRGSDIICRSGGLVVQVRGRRPRVVPVLSRYHEALLASAAFAGTGLVTGGCDPARRNVTTPLTGSLAGGGGLPRLDTSRLRATWLSDCAERLGLATFLHAAGISCSQRLGDLTARLDIAGEAGAVALLGGTR
jgi:integrase